MMKKYILLLLMVLAHSIVISQSSKKDSNTTKDSTLKDQALFEDMLKNVSTNKYKSKMGSVASEMSSTYHGQNVGGKIPSKKNDFGSSKYDSEINWATDIDENDIQRSLNRYRKQRQEEELQPYYNIAIGILIIFLVFSVYYYNKNN